MDSKTPEETSDNTQQGPTATPPLGCDSSIPTTATGREGKASPRAGDTVTSACREMPMMQHACVRVGWPCLCNEAA